MAKSLLEQLPEIVANGRKEAEKILESIESRHRISLQTREWVLPSKDTAATDWITANTRQESLRQDSLRQQNALSSVQSGLFGQVQPSLGDDDKATNTQSDAQNNTWTNRLIYGDNLLAMAALLAGDETTPSLRGKVDLIYIDPPFDSKADYRTKVTLPGVELEQKPTVIEQFAYSDTWSDGTASYLAMITPRLILMRELLSDSGSIYVHLDWHVGHYVKLVLDEVFGKDNFRNEIVWHYSGWNKQLQTAFEKRHDTIYMYGKSDAQFFESFFEMWSSKEEYVKKRKQKVHTDFDGREYVLSDAGNGERIKRYLDDVMREGVVVDDVWHMDKLNNSSNESVGYSTQKTEELLSRIIQASCPKNGIVADFNGGSGTTAAVEIGRASVGKECVP